MKTFSFQTTILKVDQFWYLNVVQNKKSFYDIFITLNILRNILMVKEIKK